MELLPIGSVVLLKEAEKRLMIYGILQINEDNGMIYDYLGCLYPEGFISIENAYMFNHVDIEKIDFIGYVDSEYQLFRVNLISELNLLKDTEEEVVDAVEDIMQE